VLGVVLAPVTGELYVAEHGEGAWLQTQAGGEWQRIQARALAQPPVLAGSRSHGNEQAAMLQTLLGDDHRLVPLGSSLKFCLIARGAMQTSICDWARPANGIPRLRNACCRKRAARCSTCRVNRSPTTVASRCSIPSSSPSVTQRGLGRALTGHGLRVISKFGRTH
jgi:hypothetical protein